MLLMAKANSNGGQPRGLAVLSGTVLTVVIIGCLFWAQVIFIPLALAIYLAFLLSPVVSFLQRRRLPRVPAVLVVVTTGTMVLGSVGWVVTHEFAALVRELPSYKGVIQQKIRFLREATENSPLKSLGNVLEEIPAKDASAGGKAAVKPPPEATRDATTAASPAQRPTIEVEPAGSPWLSRLPGFLSSVAETLGALALTLVLVVFVLLKREDLRNRVIRLIGHSQIALTTKALDEAAQRLSRYLLVQALSNAGFGVVLSIGLLLIGVPYAFLWGFLAALLRYLPYVGTWVASMLPLILSIATSEGWLSPILVLLLFGAMELFYSNLVEPRILGQSMGVSEVALLIAAAFWAFLWGPIGLVLSNPLSVFLVVLGKYFPRLEIFTVVLGDEPALEPHVSYYQRLLARDTHEAKELVDAHIKKGSLEAVYDELLIPALTLAKRDRERDELTDDDEQFILDATRGVVAELGKRAASDQAAEPKTGLNGDHAPAPKVHVLCCPARDATDELALEMFRQLLDARWEVDVAAIEMLSAEMVALAEKDQPALICISSLPPGGLSQARYLCKRLRAKMPEARILVGRWGLTNGLEQNEEQLREAGADEVDATMLATRHFLRARYPLLVHTAGEPAGAVH